MMRELSMEELNMVVGGFGLGDTVVVRGTRPRSGGGSSPPGQMSDSQQAACEQLAWALENQVAEAADAQDDYEDSRDVAGGAGAVVVASGVTCASGSATVIGGVPVCVGAAVVGGVATIVAGGALIGMGYNDSREERAQRRASQLRNQMLRMGCTR